MNKVTWILKKKQLRYIFEVYLYQSPKSSNFLYTDPQPKTQ